MGVCVYARACAVRKKGGERESRKRTCQENEEASISFLEPRPNHGIIYAKQAVVARGNFRELPLLRLITSYPPRSDHRA